MAKKKSGNGVDLKSVFKSYAKAEAEVTAARAALETAMQERSEAVRSIFESAGVGPFHFEGRLLTVVKRSSKIKDEEGNDTGERGPETFFFKSAGGEVINI